MAMLPATKTAHIGHNQPPAATLTELLDPDNLRDQWSQDYAPLVARKQELLDGVARALEKFSAGIPTQADADKLADFSAKQIAKAIRGSKQAFETEKAPLREASTACDSFFTAAITRPLEAGMKAIDKLVKDFKVRLAEEARLQRERAAEERRIEADRVAKLAMASKSADLREEAIALDDFAQRAEAQALAPTPDVSRSHSDLGTVTSLRDNWSYELEDFNAVPDELKVVNHTEVMSRIKAGARDIPGLRIFNDYALTKRG